MRKSKICFYLYISIFLIVLLIPPSNYKNGNREFNTEHVKTTFATNIKTSVILPNEMWNKSWTGPDNISFGRDIDLDSKNNIYTTGQFGQFGPSLSSSNITINKTDNMGKLLWSKIISNDYFNEGRGIVCDSLNNTYVTGMVNISLSSDPDVFVAKYNESGDLEWFETWGDLEMITVKILQLILMVMYTLWVILLVIAYKTMHY